MTRLADITYEQVRAKMQEAKQRIQDAMLKAIDAKSEAEYNAVLDELDHAARDYNVWKRVAEHLAGRR